MPARLRFGDARFALAYFALAPLYLAPLVVTRFLPAFDLPHHLAIADALLKAGAVDSPYARLFSVGLEIAPFDAHFVALTALGGWMPLSTAAKVLVGAEVLALPLAAARLLGACGRCTMPAVLAFPLGYAMPLHYGLIAFVLAVPLLIWLLGEAADTAAWVARPRRQALLLGALLVALFFVHLEAWALGVVAAASAALLQPLAWKQRLLGALAALPSLVPFSIYFARISAEPAFARAPSPTRVVLGERARELADNGLLHDLFARLRGLPVHLLRGFTDGSDVLLAGAFFALVGLLAVAGWGSARFALPRKLGRPGATAAVGCAALAAYFGLPHHALPHAYSVYPRFAVVLAVVALLAIPKSFARLPARAANAATLLVACAVAFHGLVLVRRYSAFGRELADFEQLLDVVPAGHAAGGLVFEPESRVMNIGGIFTGIPAYYATERRSPRSATYLYYCAWPQLPCRMREPGRAPPLPFFSYPRALDPRRALEEIDLYLVRGGPPAEQIFHGETPRVRLIAERGSWRAFLRH